MFNQPTPSGLTDAVNPNTSSGTSPPNWALLKPDEVARRTRCVKVMALRRRRRRPDSFHSPGDARRAIEIHPNRAGHVARTSPQRLDTGQLVHLQPDVRSRNGSHHPTLMARGSIYTRQTKSGETRHVIMYRTADGTQVKRTVIGGRRAAERELADAMARVNRGELRSNSNAKFDEYARAWLENHRLHIETGTYEPVGSNVPPPRSLTVDRETTYDRFSAGPEAVARFAREDARELD